MKLFSKYGFKLTEFFVLFILIPVGFTTSLALWIKFCVGIIGFAYAVVVLLRVEKVKIKFPKGIGDTLFWNKTLFKLIVLVLVTVAYMYFYNKAAMFPDLSNNPNKWLFFVSVYSLFSVFPQELVYRTFYFKRYNNIFQNQSLFVFLNAIVFALAHLFFRNTFVLILTFLGGLLFALTYSRTSSTVLVSIEHAIYGSWLYTVGMGGMLGFP